MMLKTEASAYEPAFDHVPEQTCDAQAITISVFENEIPSFVGRELDLLYGNLYSSLAQFKVNGKLDKASTYVVRQGGKAVTVFLFRLENGKVEVLNEVIFISAEQIKQFVTIVFSRFHSAKFICFRSIQTDAARLPFPLQKINCLEDIVVTLPPRLDDYLAQLGKNTRRNIKRYTNRLKLDFPSISFEIHAQDDVPDQMIRDIVELNKARMRGKNKISAIDAHEVDKLIKLVKTCGLVCVAMVDKKICAGAISFRTGENYFLNVLAHDPAYDDYWLGILCCYHTIGECIARRGKEFHFLWGRYDYKYTLLGVQRDLDYLVVYRSYLQFVFNSDTAFTRAFEGWIRKVKLELQEAKRRDSPTYRRMMSLMDYLRALKQFKLDFPGWRR